MYIVYCYILLYTIAIGCLIWFIDLVMLVDAALNSLYSYWLLYGG